MKTQNLFLVNRIAIVAIAVLLWAGTAAACNLAPAQPQALAQVTQNFAASASLPAGVTSGATVVVVPQYVGLPGFQNASLTAYIDPGNMTLNAVLTGYAYDDLPPNTVLATIKVQEDGLEWSYVVVSDGLELSLEEEF